MHDDVDPAGPQGLFASGGPQPAQPTRPETPPVDVPDPVVVGLRRRFRISGVALLVGVIWSAVIWASGGHATTVAVVAMIWMIGLLADAAITAYVLNVGAGGTWIQVDRYHRQRPMRGYERAAFATLGVSWVVLRLLGFHGVDATRYAMLAAIIGAVAWILRTSQLRALADAFRIAYGKPPRPRAETEA
jgi:hypothetical protein